MGSHSTHSDASEPGLSFAEQYFIPAVDSTGPRARDDPTSVDKSQECFPFNPVSDNIQML